jgi:DNA-binding NarL/FixJ family response regulator
MMKRKIRLAIADDHTLFRQGLSALLSDYDELKVVTKVPNGLELVQSLKSKPVDVAIVDYEMPEMDGLETTRQIRLKYPDTKIISLTMHNSEDLILQLLDKGTNGFLLKDFDSEKVVDAIYAVLENGYYFNDHISKDMLHHVMKKQKLKPRFGMSALSDKEIQIIRLICEEKTNKEISEILNLSPRTIEGSRARIIQKINVKNTAGIVLYAIKNNIIY